MILHINSSLIINNTKKRNVLFIGNFLSNHGYNPSQLELIRVKLNRYAEITSHSRKLNKFYRMIDMLWGIFLKRGQKTLVFIDTYSHYAFYYALFCSIFCQLLNIKYIPILRGGNLPMRLRKNPYLSKFIFNHVVNKLKGKLDPNDQNSQDIIAGYLERTDPAKNKSLKEILKKEGQKEAAVITADGFLINGNRRKWALQKLNEEFPDEKFKTMKVVILPDEGDEGGPPTIKEIEQVENRCQMQKSGKSDYYDFDKLFI